MTSSALDAALDLRDALSDLVGVVRNGEVGDYSPIMDELFDAEHYLREFDKHWYTSDNYDKEGFRK